MENLVGLVLPLIIDLLNRFVPNSNLRYVISLVICLIVAALLNLSAIQLGDSNSFFASFGIIFAEAQSVYKIWWGKSGSRKSLGLVAK